jgi:hypothetical protein
VDQLGYLDDALELARARAHLNKEARVVRYHRPGGYKPTIYSRLPDLDLTMAGPQFLYIWWSGGI